MSNLEDIVVERDALQGHVRRLEKSNADLALENHLLKLRLQPKRCNHGIIGPCSVCLARMRELTTLAGF